MWKFRLLILKPNPCLILAFTAINLPLNTALVASHNFDMLSLCFISHTVFSNFPFDFLFNPLVIKEKVD